MDPDLQPHPTIAGAEPPGGDFLARLDSFRALLEARLDDWLVTRAGERGGLEVDGADDLDASLRDFVARGGKRLRPALVYWSYRGCGGRSDEAILPLAMAVELLHTYLLVHDDIMDRSETRRGGPAAHADYRDRHRAAGRPGSAEHFGTSAAILLGDLAHSYAVELAAETLVAHGGDALRRTFAAMCQEVVVGQYLEVTVPFHERPTADDLLRILQLKSGRYSVQRPLELGALAAGAGAATCDALSRYGAAMGEAFQLQDDLLGTFGRPEKTGKPVSSDLEEGKLTLLVFHGLERAPEDDAAAIRRALGDRSLDPEEADRVRRILEASGARGRVEEMIRERLETARAALDGAELEPEGRETFRALIRYLGERER